MAKGKASNFFVWGILFLLIIALGAGFGATNFGGTVQTVGRVGETEIEVDRYARELQQELRAITAQQGRAVPLSEAQALGVPQAVLGRIVGLAALEDEAATLGLSVGDETVRAQILDIPAFQGVDGSFDREAYGFVLESSGLTVAEFEERVRVETAANIVQQAAVSGVAFPPVFADTLWAFARETRDISWAELAPDALETIVPEPSEAQVTQFHGENPELFTAPETRAITYAWLTPDMMLDTIEPDEAALRAVYDDRIADFVQPERRLVERLVFADAATAEAARARIEAGETDFDALVAERGLELADIDLGDVARAALGEAAEAVFALEAPGIAGPAPSSLGPALFRVNAILAPREITFEQAREDLLPEVMADRARRVILEMFDDLDDRLAGGATLEDLAEETEMALGRIDFAVGTSEGIAAYESFRAAALAAEEGDFPELVEMPEGGVFALRLDEVRAPALRPLDEVRDEVVAAWTARETARLMTDEAEEVAASLRGGREMTALTLPQGSQAGLGREAFLAGAPGGLLAAVFAMEPQEVRVIADETVAWIVQLDQVTPADQDGPEAQALKQLLAQQVAQDASTDMLTAFTQALTAQKGVEINQAAINAVHAQFP
jgi:peptidyl-prolyl cis-trans isomerase D